MPTANLDPRCFMLTKNIREKAHKVFVYMLTYKCMYL